MICLAPAKRLFGDGLWGSCVTGVCAAYLSARVEPFKSNLFLAIVAASGIGVLSAVIEIFVRRVAGGPLASDREEDISGRSGRDQTSK